MISLSCLQPSTTNRTSLSSSLHSKLHHRFSLSRRPRFPLRPIKPHRLTIRSIDAAQPYDYEAQISDRHRNSTKLKIAIIGFGNFGQFLAKALIRQGHTVLAHSRSDYSATAADLGVSFFADADDLCEEHPEVSGFAFVGYAAGIAAYLAQLSPNNYSSGPFPCELASHKFTVLSFWSFMGQVRPL